MTQIQLDCKLLNHDEYLHATDFVKSVLPTIHGNTTSSLHLIPKTPLFNYLFTLLRKIVHDIKEKLSTYVIIIFSSKLYWQNPTIHKLQHTKQQQSIQTCTQGE